VSVLFFCVRHLGTLVNACHNCYGTVRGLQGSLGKPYMTSTFRKLELVVLNIYNTVHTYKIKKSGTITGKAAILEPLNETNICGRNPKNEYFQNVTSEFFVRRSAHVR